MQKWWKRRKLRKELPPEEVSFNKTQDAVTVKVSQKFAPEEENRPKTPSPMEYDNHPGHAGPMLRDGRLKGCLLYTSPSPRDATLSRMPSSA